MARVDEARAINPHFLAVLAFAGLVAAVAAVIALTGNPMDGEPVVRFDISTPATPPPPPAPRSVEGNLVFDPALIERTEAGEIPRIAADGRTPMAAYAADFSAPADIPRIAIVIGGLGLSASATTLALERLPKGVTLSFAPYAADVQHWVDQARGQGHEVLLEVPMEPMGASNPGPHTLLTAASAEANLQNLHWALARFSGYVGLTNLLGARFLSDRASALSLLAECRKRGLLFFDNGANPHTLTADAGGQVGAPSITGALVLDADKSPDAIRARLADLEQQARGRGAASASGFLYPETIAAVADWATSLEKKGLVLAPLTATASQPPQALPQH